MTEKKHAEPKSSFIEKSDLQPKEHLPCIYSRYTLRLWECIIDNYLNWLIVIFANHPEPESRNKWGKIKDNFSPCLLANKSVETPLEKWIAKSERGKLVIYTQRWYSTILY